MAHCDAAGVNGSSRIRSHGARPGRVMPNGCLGSPVLVLPPALTEASSWMSDRVASGRYRPEAPTDPYVLALEHTVRQLMASLRV